jgi:sugar/nucleoside kinase (ribokinase family)
MNYWISKKKDELLKTMSEVDILIINETEIKMLSQETKVLRAVKKIKKMGPKIVLVKYGARGAALFYEDKHFVIPATPVSKVIDPTGAGDTFAGGFIGYFAQQLKKNGKIDYLTLKRATVYGNIMASFTIEGFGLENLKKVDNIKIMKRFKDFKELVDF